MESIRDIIPHVIQTLSDKKPVSKRNIHESWKVIAKDGAEHSSVMDYKKGILRINVDSSAWLYQLSIQKTVLLKNLKKEIPDITDIVFKVGKIN